MSELMPKNEAINKLDILLNKVESTIGKTHTSFNKKLQQLAEQPKCLSNGKLKPYQLEALNWMIQLVSKGMNGILADEMGLGKTIQTISYFAYLKEKYKINGKHIIVAPLTVLSNWLRQLKKWLPDFQSVILYATEFQRESIIKKIIKPRKFDIIITSYQGIINSYNALSTIKWQCFVIDQGHKIKNDQAIVSQYVRGYQCNFKLLLTGTPLSNRLHQLWSLLNFVLPDLFNDNTLFKQIEQVVKDMHGDQKEKFQTQVQIANKFHRIITPFILRRTKVTANLNLPPKIQKTIFVGMTQIQLKMYKNFLKYHSVYGQHEGYQSSTQVQLRKVCNHPYLFPKIQSKNAQEYGQHLIQACGKMRVFDKLLTKLLSEQHKVLIFSQFTTVLNIIQDYCIYKKYQYCRIDGSNSLAQKDQQIQKFTKGNNVSIFLLSTKSGGLGINLVEADRVIIYDIDWNPQNDNQAMDRSHRIGQTKPVHVFKLITEFTVEERMLQIQKYKLIWDELVIQKGAMFRKSKDDVLNGVSYDQIAKKGKGDIFRLELGCDDKTIDELINIGEEKDQKKNNQIKQKLISFIRDQSYNPFQNEAATNEQIQYLPQILRENKEKNIIKEEKCIYVQVPYYQLFRDRAKIKELYQKRQNLKSKQQYQYYQLNKQIIEEEKYGFKDWSIKDYKAFINASLKYQKQNFEKISQQMSQSQKSKEEVQKYSQAFFKYGYQYKQLTRDTKRLQKFNKQLENIKQRQKIIKWKQENNITLKNYNQKNKIQNMNQITMRSYFYQVCNSKLDSSKGQTYKAYFSCPIFNLLPTLKKFNIQYSYYLRDLEEFKKVQMNNKNGKKIEKRALKLMKKYGLLKALKRQQYKDQNQNEKIKLIQQKSVQLEDGSKGTKTQKIEKERNTMDQTNTQEIIVMSQQKIFECFES